jgi:hypothetical protein
VVDLAKHKQTLLLHKYKGLSHHFCDSPFDKGGMLN